jgi:GT2 family glycosyltransferase
VLLNGISHSQILVVDNGSNDESVNNLSNAYPGVQMFCLQENLGYAGGYNFGIESALHQGAKAIFILNNDTIIDPQAISLLLASAWDISVPKIFFHEHS